MTAAHQGTVCGADLRAAFSLRAEPVCAITSCDEYGERIGMTATSVTSVSLDPPMLLVCVASRSLLASAMRAKLPFVVHFLSTEQEDIARRLASPIEDKFREVSHYMSSSGAARLKAAQAILECEPDQVHQAGDHLVVIGLVTRIDHAASDGPALLFHGGRFTRAE
ncbi:MAG TPA: flavin reductase family protein [Solirubrobacteraceae bacterium]|nr:flavin reductase family protein [Solirubrobacteraceae bacterium]